MIPAWVAAMRARCEHSTERTRVDMAALLDIAEALARALETLQASAAQYQRAVLPPSGYWAAAGMDRAQGDALDALARWAAGPGATTGKEPS